MSLTTPPFFSNFFIKLYNELAGTYWYDKLILIYFAVMCGGLFNGVINGGVFLANTIVYIIFIFLMFQYFYHSVFKGIINGTYTPKYTHLLFAMATLTLVLIYPVGTWINVADNPATIISVTVTKTQYIIEPETPNIMLIPSLIITTILGIAFSNIFIGYNFRGLKRTLTSEPSKIILYPLALILIILFIMLIWGRLIG